MPLLLLLALRLAAARYPARWRVGAAGGGGHHPDAVRGGLEGKRPGDRVHPALGGRVGQPIQTHRRNRGDVDDRAVALGVELRQHRAAPPQGGIQRPVDLGGDLGGIVFLIGFAPDRAAHDVDRDVDPAELGDRLVDHRLGPLEGLQVGELRRGAGRALGRILSELVGQRLDQFAAVGEHQTTALGVDPAGDGLPDPLGGAGDQHHLAGEPARADVGRPLALVLHRPAHGQLGPVGVRHEQLPGAFPVPGGDRVHHVDVVPGDQRVAPGGVLEGLLHRPLHPETLVRLAQVVVAGEGEQVVVEGRIGLGVGHRSDERFPLHIRQSRLREHPVAGDLAGVDPAQHQFQRAELEGLPGLEDCIGAQDRGMFLTDLVVVAGAVSPGRGRRLRRTHETGGDAGRPVTTHRDQVGGGEHRFAEQVPAGTGGRDPAIRGQ